jgi:hypothetical protein
MLVYIFILIDFFNLKIIIRNAWTHILTRIEILGCIFLDVDTISVCLFHNYNKYS